MSIPAYPAFAALERAHKPRFDELLRAHPPEISELTFTNLFAWRQTYHFEVSEGEGTLLVRAGTHKVFPPVGATDAAAAAAQRLLAQPGVSLVRAPESLKDALAHLPGIHAQPDPDNFDYVYRTQDLIALAGRKYDGKRNLIRKFKSSHAFTYRVLDAASIEECLRFEEYWCSMRDCDSVEGLANERRAFRQMLHEFAAFGLRGGAVTVGGRMVALALAEPLNPSTLVMHILKADPNLPGLYQTMHQEFLARQGADFAYVNMEQDLGLPGLRKAKESYQPAFLVKKFTLTRAPSVPA